MAIFLGKNLLGQSDQVTHNLDIEIAIAKADRLQHRALVRRGSELLSRRQIFND